MRLLESIDILAGGPGSGCNPAAAHKSGHECGRPPEGMSQRAWNALRTYVPQNREKHTIALNNEVKLAKILNAPATHKQHTVDIIKGRHAIEVKTIFPTGKRPAITMHPKSLRRKKSFVRKEKLKPHTIVFDQRGKKTKIFYRKGFGSYTLGSMQQITVQELKELFT